VYNETIVARGFRLRTRSGPALCLACDGPIQGPLAELGSLRCADCRAERRALEAELVRKLSRGRPKPR
jgi:hypothetical protein